MDTTWRALCCHRSWKQDGTPCGGSGTRLQDCTSSIVSMPRSAALQRSHRLNRSLRYRPLPRRRSSRFFLLLRNLHVRRRLRLNLPSLQLLQGSACQAAQRTIQWHALRWQRLVSSTASANVCQQEALHHRLFHPRALAFPTIRTSTIPPHANLWKQRANSTASVSALPP